MRIPRLAINREEVSHGVVRLPRNASRYVTRVLRLHQGDRVELFNGGDIWLTRVLGSGGSLVELEVVEHRSAPNHAAARITLAFGCVRPGPMEQIFRHGTELGVARFVPLLTRRVTRRPGGKKDRWTRICAEASAQCGRTDVPGVSEPMTLARALAEEGEASWTHGGHEPDVRLDPGAGPMSSAGGLVREGPKSESTHEDGPEAQPVAPCPAHGRGQSHSPGERFLLSRAEDAALLAGLLPDIPFAAVTLLAGPEGGFTGREEEESRNAGFMPVRLGATELRTETACIVSVGMISAWYGW